MDLYYKHIFLRLHDYKTGGAMVMHTRLWNRHYGGWEYNECCRATMAEF